VQLLQGQDAPKTKYPDAAFGWIFGRIQQKLYIRHQRQKGPYLEMESLNSGKN
jgi:hypothetical protein